MSPNAEPSQETTDAFVISAHSDLAAVKRVLEEYPSVVNRPASWGERAIQGAAQMGQKDIAELLLGAGAPLDICTAAMLGLTDRVEQFLQSDPALAYATGAHKLPVLFHAAVSGQIPVAEVLVAHGADVNAGTGKNTALHGAVFFGQPEMVRWLVTQGADVNAPDLKGKTPLAIATQLGNDEIVQILRQAGASG